MYCTVLYFLFCFGDVARPGGRSDQETTARPGSRPVLQKRQGPPLSSSLPPGAPGCAPPGERRGSEAVAHQARGLTRGRAQQHLKRRCMQRPRTPKQPQVRRSYDICNASQKIQARGPGNRTPPGVGRSPMGLTTRVRPSRRPRSVPPTQAGSDRNFSARRHHQAGGVDGKRAGNACDKAPPWQLLLTRTITTSATLRRRRTPRWHQLSVCHEWLGETAWFRGLKQSCAAADLYPSHTKRCRHGARRRGAKRCVTKGAGPHLHEERPFATTLKLREAKGVEPLPGAGRSPAGLTSSERRSRKAKRRGSPYIYGLT